MRTGDFREDDSDLAALPREVFGIPAPSPAFREQVWLRTAARIRWRRRRRRWAIAGGLLAAYAAGAITIVLAWRSEPVLSPPETKSISQAAMIPVSSPAGAVTTAMLQDSEALTLALAKASAAERRSLLREAGDRYLEEYGDLARATQCYRRLLDVMPPEELKTVEYQDTWLLASLKLARHKETQDESPHT